MSRIDEDRPIITSRCLAFFWSLLFITRWQPGRTGDQVVVAATTNCRGSLRICGSPAGKTNVPRLVRGAPDGLKPNHHSNS